MKLKDAFGNLLKSMYTIDIKFAIGNYEITYNINANKIISVPKRNEKKETDGKKGKRFSVKLHQPQRTTRSATKGIDIYFNSIFSDGTVISHFFTANVANAVKSSLVLNLAKRPESSTAISSIVQPQTSAAAPKSLSSIPPPPPPPFPKSNIKPIQCSSSHLKPKKTFQANVPMKKLNWPEIEPRNISKNGFWAKCQEDKLASQDILAGLAAKFSQKNTAMVEKNSIAHRLITKKFVDLRVISRKSAHAISILLESTLKRVSYEQFKERILRCDTSDAFVLTSDVIQQLIKYLPSPEQMKRLVEIKKNGDELSKPETFVATIGEIDQLVPRLHSIDLKLCLDDVARDIGAKIDIGTAACKELENSKKFGHILEIILLFGNYMNSGLAKSEAFGFDISFLTQLKETKDVDNKHTLLHYIVESIEKKFPELLSFGEEIPHLGQAARISLVRINAEMQQIKTSLENLNMALENIQEPQSSDDKFCEIMGDIAVRYNEKVQALTETKEKMENSYKKLGEYFSFNPERYPIEDLFRDINSFTAMFKQAHNEVQHV